MTEKLYKVEFTLKQLQVLTGVLDPNAPENSELYEQAEMILYRMRAVAEHLEKRTHLSELETNEASEQTQG